MATVKISALTPLGAMTDASILPVTSSGTTYSVSGTVLSSYLLNKVSVTTATASGAGSLAFNSGSGVLTFTPAVEYSLPTASNSQLGGVKVDASTITIDGSGVIKANYTNYSLPTATSSVLGGVKVGTNISVAGDGTISWSQPLQLTNLTDIVFNTSPTVTTAPGMVYWNSAQGGLETQLDSNTSGTTCQDNFYYVKATGAITKGQLCYFVGTDGASGHIQASSIPSGVAQGTLIMGIAAESISNGNFGYVQWSGFLIEANTSAYSNGSILYYDYVNGGMTATHPGAQSGPIVQVAAVVYSHASHGVYEIRVTNQQRVVGSGGVTVTQTAANAAISLDSTILTNSGSQAITNKTLTGNLTVSGTLIVKDVRDTVYDLGTTGGTITPDAANGDVQTITLNGALTLNGFSNPQNGQTITFIINQGTGGFALTSGFKFAGGYKTLSNAAGAIDILHVSYFGSTYYASLITGYV